MFQVGACRHSENFDKLECHKYLVDKAKENPQLSANELYLKAELAFPGLEINTNAVKKVIYRARQYRYPRAPDRENLAGTDFTKTLFKDFHVFSKKSATGETIIFLALKSAYPLIADAEGIITDGTFKTRACFGQLYVLHATVGPQIQPDHDTSSYENQLRKNFTRPVGYCFMENRTQASYELMWESLKEELNGELKIDWQGPEWILSDFEQAQKNAVAEVSQKI